MQWIAYFQYDNKKPIPIATGATREEAVSLAVVRTLCRGVVDGVFCCQQLEDVPVADYEGLTNTLNDFFAAAAADDDALAKAEG